MAHKKPSGWDSVSHWYDGWVGKNGSRHHREYAIPAVLHLANIQPHTQILDIGAGTGVLAPHIKEAGAHYTGIDISKQLISLARKHHGKRGRFLVGDARRLPRLVDDQHYDTCIFLLSIQDMNPLEVVLEGAAYALRGGGQVVILMTHPCFRIPRQSGWGHDPNRKLQYRRIDHYLTPLKIPMKQHKQGVTISFHRPLSDYINALGSCGLLLEHMQEIAVEAHHLPRSERRAHEQFPLFLGLRARKAN